MNVFPYSLLVLAGGLLLAGCSTPSARISRNPAVFDRCTPQQQDLIRHGQIALGFDPDMVRLALGNPDRITTRTDASGESETWHYAGYEQDVDVGYYPGWWRFHGTVFAPYYLEDPAYAQYDRFRVVFKNGKVASIEQESE